MKRLTPKNVVCIRCNLNFLSFGNIVKRCSDCRKLKWKLYRKSKNWGNSVAGKEYIKNYHKRNSENHKKIIFGHYGKVCRCCGEKLVSMLTVDHVNNDGFIDRKLKISGVTFYKKIIKLNFPDSYQILCMNCNWSKKINKGICEHQIK